AVCCELGWRVLGLAREAVTGGGSQAGDRVGDGSHRIYEDVVLVDVGASLFPYTRPSDLSKGEAGGRHVTCRQISRNGGRGDIRRRQSGDGEGVAGCGYIGSRVLGRDREAVTGGGSQAGDRVGDGSHRINEDVVLVDVVAG